jgi:phosphatidylethanolamine/phosphatidyl-N-methylethanolamine N-methyltransferase
MGLITKLTDTSLFLQEWLNAPRCIASVVPSSRRLSNEMARWVPLDQEGYVVELGPGTGAITEALLAHGVHRDRLIAVERTPVLADLLRQRFHGAHIITGDALELSRLLRHQIKNELPVLAVVSSLPLRHFSDADARTLTEQIHATLAPGGLWTQYSYHLGKERPEGSAVFEAIHSEVIWRNIPPAKVTVYRKSQ